jgi:hypothetical protein
MSAPFRGPGAQGLYDPRFEHDSCGIGFVVDAHGRRSHSIVDQAIQVLLNLEHRGACGCEKNTGDGAGILMQMPHAFLAEEAGRSGIALPGPGGYGAGLVFLPRDPAARRRCEELFERTAAEEAVPFLGGRPLDDLLAAAAGDGFGGQEHEGGAVTAGPGQRDPGLAAGVGQEAVRHLHQDAGAVAGVLLAAAGAAVLQVQQHLDRLLHDAVGLAAVGVHDEADPARVVLVAGIVETLGARTWRVFHGKGSILHWEATRRRGQAGVFPKKARYNAWTARSTSASSTTTEMFTSEAAKEIITTFTSASASKMRRARPA